MDTYMLVLNTLSDAGIMASHDWPEMQALFKRVAFRKPRDWQLPVITCQAVGGRLEQSGSAAAAIACAQISIILIDDLLDDDPRGEYQTLGAPRVANLAAAFQAAALEAISYERVVADPLAKLIALRSLSQMILTTAFGQSLDIQNPSDEDAYWRTVEAKSAPFYGTAFQLGALMGGASLEVAEHFNQLGRLYGEIIQIHDDLNDSLAIPANPDWTLGRSPLPVLFAQVVEHSDRAKFLELRRAIPDPAALAEAQTILIRCGAISYSLYQLLWRYQKAQEILKKLPLAQRDDLTSLLDDLVKPVRRLFATIRTPLP